MAATVKNGIDRLRKGNQPSRHREIIILHKANGDHVTNTDVASKEKISSSSALSFAVDESDRKEKCYLNPAFKTRESSRDLCYRVPHVY